MTMKATTILLTDGSAESSEALSELKRSKLPFTLLPGDEPGPVLFSADRSFRGLAEVKRYVEEEKKSRK